MKPQLWHAESGRVIFRAIMPLCNFQKLWRVIRFDDKETMCQERTQQTVSDRWGKNGFNGFNTSKAVKYCIQILAACDASTSYAWNLPVYTGKLVGHSLKEIRADALYSKWQLLSRDTQRATISSHCMHFAQSFFRENWPWLELCAGTSQSSHRRQIAGLWHCFSACWMFPLVSLCCGRTKCIFIL